MTDRQFWLESDGDDEPGWWTTPPLTKPHPARAWLLRVALVVVIVGVFMLADWLLT